MSAYTISPEKVVSPGAGRVAMAGQTISAGVFIFINPATNTAWPAINIALATSLVVGMSIAKAYAGQPLHYVDSGDIVVDTAGPGSIFGSEGRSLCLSGTSGKCMDLDDITEGGEYLTILGWSASATAIRLAIGPSGLLATLS